MRFFDAVLLLIAGMIIVAEAHAEDFAQIKEIEGYKQWNFSRGPFEVSPGMEALCIHYPFVSHPGTEEEGGEGRLKETLIRVYANEIASGRIRTKSPQPFDVGSVILKEKLSGAKASTPESLGIMIKREAGFDPKHGNWEFIFLASGKRVAKGSPVLENCYHCHQAKSFGGAKTSDFVFVDQYK